jgi:Domain of unknown function (DUF4268)
VSSVVNLGRLEPVDLRQAWPDEAKNFTPWLAEEENLSLLGSILGIQLELEAVEKQVGPFWADILAKDSVGGGWVLIENQIEITDHSHLGQILTYAAGLDVSVVVWIAREFREQHRAALDFLNRVTDENHLFFGVKVELFKIGQSSFAPNFTLVAKPNDWSKQTAAAKFAAEDSLSPTQALYREFWTQLILKAKEVYPALAARKPYKGNWQTAERIGSGVGFAIDSNAAFVTGNRLRIEAYISGASAPSAFDWLLQRKNEIESQFGQELTWETLQGHEKRIALYMDGAQKKDDKNQWVDQQDWLLTNWRKLSEVFGPYVAKIEIENEGVIS